MRTNSLASTAARQLECPRRMKMKMSRRMKRKKKKSGTKKKPIINPAPGNLATISIGASALAVGTDYNKTEPQLSIKLVQVFGLLP